MNKNKLKSYAPAARRDFIQAVTDRAHFYGLSENEIIPVEVSGDVVIIGGRPFPRSVAVQRKKLEERVKREGFNQVMEAVAYTWFNRFLALRYMELHGYLEHGFRVLSNTGSSTVPEILDHAAQLDLPELNKQKVIELKLDGSKDAELYRLLLVAQCNALHAAMPFLFEKIEDETELLLPDNLLHSDSLIRKLVTEIDEEDWQEVEIIGWLYQFYISEKKDQVIGKVVKSEDIPAATQLFTPNWIVKYMVQNSLGRQWMATYPNSPLKAKMEYYIEPAEQTEEVIKQLNEITPDSLDPEKLTLLDPACGSGHILVEAYDVFKEIYLERGYSNRDFPRLILEKNLYGLDIDDRAAQMAGFALLMKARNDDRRITRSDNPVKLNVMAIQESGDIVIDNAAWGENASSLRELVDIFKQSKTLGSLIQMPKQFGHKLRDLQDVVKQGANCGDLYVSQIAVELIPLVEQGVFLTNKYDCVVANPPYMGGRGFNTKLKDFISDVYPESKENIFAAFINRASSLAKSNGQLAMVTMHNWMFTSRFESFRKGLLNKNTILSLVHLGAGAFEEISGEVVQTVTFNLFNRSINGYSATYISSLNLNGESKCQSISDKTLHYIGSKQQEFELIPGEPVAYWLTPRFLSIFAGQPMGNICDPREGLATGNNAVHVRLWCEVNIDKFGLNINSRNDASVSGKKWFPYNKGGEYKKWYGNIDNIVNWENDGYLLQNTLHPSGGRIWAHNFNLEYIFKHAVTWTDITSCGLAARYMPTGCLFDATGLSAFYYDDDKLWEGIAIANSIVSSEVASVLNPTLHFKAGDFRRLPLPPCLPKQVTDNAKELVELAKQSWDSEELSWDFSRIPFVQQSLKSATLFESWQNWEKYCVIRFNRTQYLETENNQLIIESFGLSGELSPDVPEDRITVIRADREADMKRLISFTIGCMMGRYSLDQLGLIYAYSGNTGFIATQYQTFPADDDGIVPVMDMDWFPDDAASRFEEFLKVAWSPETLEENMKFVADSLSPKGGETPRETIRRYISIQFFKDHLQNYKKRPIYWLFSSGKQRAFECLVYLHRYNESTLSRMRNEYVTPLQGKFSAQADYLASEVNAATSTAERNRLQKQLDSLRKKQVELAAFDDLLRHYADQRISLDLDEGVKVNYGKFGALLAEVKAVTGGGE